MRSLDRRCLSGWVAGVLLVLLGPGAAPTLAYVGPGAGTNGTGGIGLIGLAVVLFAGLIALGALCGVIALIVTLARRLRRRSSSA